MSLNSQQSYFSLKIIGVNQSVCSAEDFSLCLLTYAGEGMRKVTGFSLPLALKLSVSTDSKDLAFFEGSAARRDYRKAQESNTLT